MRKQQFALFRTLMGARTPLIAAAAAVAALGLGGLRVGLAATPSAKVFRAGACAVDITPRKLPAIINGGMTERKSSEVTDPLFCRALVLDDGTTQVAIAVVDSCVVPRPLIDRAKALAERETGIPAGHMLVSATHCHSAPSVCGALGTGVDEDYAQFLPPKIAEAIAQAKKNLAPARIGWAVGRDPKNVFCRRFLMKPGTAPTNPFSGAKNDQAMMNPGYQNPNAIRRTGPVDDSVSVISVQAKCGRPIAVLGNYSTHYAGAPGISADYFGVFCRRIGELIGAKGEPAFVGLMTNGTSGDANCCDFVNPPRKFDHFTVGEDVAQAAFAAYKTIPYYDWVPLAVAEKELTLDVRMPSAQEVAEAKEFLAKANLPDGKPRTVPEVYARETIILSELPPTRQVNLQAMRIGGLGIAAFPNEVFGSTGLEVKARSPLRPTVNIELANGYYGYLPPPDQFPLGGYTTWRARSSCLEVQAEPKIKAAILELLACVAAARRDEAAVPAADSGHPCPSPLRLLTSQDPATGELAGWKFFSEDPKARPSDVWQLSPDGVLTCRGKPKGYLATRKDYTDFALRLEWRWPKDKAGSGGILVRMTGPDKIWPKSLEPQINAGDAGDFWGLDGFGLKGPAERMKVIAESPFGKLTHLKKTAAMEKPAGEWNHYEIVARGDTVVLSINGREVNRATGCDVTPGKICLTAEGDEYCFRNVELIPGDR